MAHISGILNTAAADINNRVLALATLKGVKPPDMSDDIFLRNNKEEIKHMSEDVVR
jgi:hypothetical protein